MNKKFVSVLMLVSLCSFNTAFAASNFSFEQPQPQPSGQYYQQPMQYSAKHNQIFANHSNAQNLYKH